MTYNTIIIKRYLHIQEEYTSTAVAITPGHLIELTSAGLVQKHATEDGNVLPMFAIEDALQGNDIDTEYAVSSLVACWIPTRGDIVNAILKDEEVVAIGDFLVSAGNGELKKYDATTSVLDAERPIGVALAALDLSSSSAATVEATRIRVRIL
ncbi:MAG: hypothetical protein WC827_03980 [Candidatus Paceibacterota bacterium]|jgi:hypothetical protein